MSKKNRTVAYVMLITVLVAIIAAAVIMIVGTLNRYDEKIAELNNENTLLSEEEKRLESLLSSLRSEKASLESDVQKLNAEITKLEANLSDAGKYFADEISALKASVAEKEAAISTLEADIACYQTVFTVDVRAQAHLIDEIVEYIENSAPYVLVPIPEDDAGSENASEETTADDLGANKEKEELTDKDLDEDEDWEVYMYTPEGATQPIECRWVSVEELIAAEREACGEEPLFTAKELEESGLSEEELTNKILHERVLAREDVFYPSVSVYYEDLFTGYHFEHNADKIYDAASVIKAPYILSVLKVIVADEAAFFEKNGAAGEESTNDIIIEYSNPIYNLLDVVAYDSEKMFKPGSGVIKDMEDGSEFTYLDFIKYTLEYSDNVAYSNLRERFGFDTMRELARTLGTKSVLKGGNSMSALDAGILFKEIYKFTEEDEKYGPIVRESMLKGNHRVIIPQGAYPSKTLHKYGWDKGAYHDAGIVLYEDKPYVLTVFTNMDNGGAEVNAYLQNIVKKINKLHKGFYGNK